MTTTRGGATREVRIMFNRMFNVYTVHTEYSVYLYMKRSTGFGQADQIIQIAISPRGLTATL